jgi:uracil-DNA glycosylase
VAEKSERVVFILWGAAARRKRGLVDAGSGAHAVIESAHPSPLSAHNGFFGSRPFSRTNAALADAGMKPIDWRVDDEA